MASAGRPLAVAAVIAWVLTASIGMYMLWAWVTRGGLRRQRATGVGVPPAAVFGHASAAIGGLLVWLAFLRTGWDPLAWAGVVCVTGAIALGICTVTLWTPYPIAVPAPPAHVTPPAATPPAAGPPAAGPPAAADDVTITDEMIAGLLANPFPAARRPRLRLAGLVPVVHGFAALTTFMLTVLAAIDARLGTFRPQCGDPRAPRLGSGPARRAVWDHGRNADDDGGARASRRRGVEHRRRAGELRRPGHQDRGRDVHQRRVR